MRLRLPLLVLATLALSSASLPALGEQPLNGPAATRPLREVEWANPGGYPLSPEVQWTMNRQVAPCWHHAGGGARSPAVAIRAELKPSGKVGAAQIVDSYRYAVDARFRRAADVALAAVLDPDCQPYDLPPQSYLDWAQVVFTFGQGR